MSSSETTQTLPMKEKKRTDGPLECPWCGGGIAIRIRIRGFIHTTCRMTLTCKSCHWKADLTNRNDDNPEQTKPKCPWCGGSITGRLKGMGGVARLWFTCKRCQWEYDYGEVHEL